MRGLTGESWKWWGRAEDEKSSSINCRRDGRLWSLGGVVAPSSFHGSVRPSHSFHKQSSLPILGSGFPSLRVSHQGIFTQTFHEVTHTEHFDV